MKQLKLKLDKGRRGGRREGSGRKRIHSKGVSHRVREKVSYRSPLHINFKYRTFIKNKACLKLLKRAIVNARSHGLRINHFSMQSNHSHLIVEAESNQILTTGMRSLTVTFAKGLKQGKIQLERYHLQVLHSIKQTRNALNYVLFNKQKHGRLSASCLRRHTGHPDHKKGTCSPVDEYCSVWCLANSVEILKVFARKAGMTLRIGEKGYFRSDQAISYFLKEALADS